ncbi:MAG: ABC transporter permease [bacterium]
MYVFNLLKYIWHNLFLQKTRSFLTMLGIIIGVASVVSVMAVGAGAESLLLNQIKSLGSNIVAVLPGASDETGPPASAFGIEVTTLTYDDVKALEDLPYYVAVCPYVNGQDVVSYGRETEDAPYVGVSSSYINVEDAEVDLGRFFRQEEVDGLSRVAVLGNQIADDLFKDQNPLNERIRIGQVSFKVVGVIKERGMTGFSSPDKQIFIPITTAQKILLGINHIHLLRGKIDNEENIVLAMSQTKKVLRYRHNISDPSKDDFSVRTTAQALDVLGSITQALSMFLVSVAAISLLVGGVGIMNIMFVSVNERTREVGLRKALGAKQGAIMIQFLIESVVLTLLGGIIGILLGVFISWAIAFGVTQFGYSWQLIITPLSVILSVTMAVIIGLIFGLWPAYKASKLEPIKALKYE